MSFEAFQLKSARKRCLTTIGRACGGAPPGINLDGLGMDALPLLAKVFDGLRGQARAARLYTRLVDAPPIRVPEDTPGIERAIILATGKPVPVKLLADLPNMEPTTLWVLEHALTTLLAQAKAAREKGRAK